MPPCCIAGGQPVCALRAGGRQRHPAGQLPSRALQRRLDAGARRLWQRGHLVCRQAHAPQLSASWAHAQARPQWPGLHRARRMLRPQGPALSAARHIRLSAATCCASSPHAKGFSAAQAVSVVEGAPVAAQDISLGGNGPAMQLGRSAARVSVAGLGRYAGASCAAC